MVRNLLILLAMTMPSFVRAATITGRVTDCNGNAIAFSTVSVSELARLAAADKYGVYTIDDIPEGKYTLVVSCVGFETIKKGVSLECDKYTFDISLKESTLELSEVFVNSVDTAMMILDKLATIPKLKKQLKNFNALYSCRIESIGNLGDCPSGFRNILRFYTGLMGYRRIFKCMERVPDLSVEVSGKAVFHNGKLTCSDESIKKCNAKISSNEEDAFKSKAMKFSGAFYDGIYNLARHLRKQHTKKKENADGRLSYCGSYIKDGKLMYVLRSKLYEMHVADGCWQVCRVEYNDNGKSKRVIECGYPLNGVYLPTYIHNADTYDWDETKKWSLVDTTVFSY